MSLNRVYYQQYKDDDGMQWLLKIIPPDNTYLDAQAYVEISPEVQFDFGEIKAGYERRPLGHIDTPSVRVSFDLEAMEETAEMQDLRSALTSPIFFNAGTLDLGNSQTASFDTGTLFVLMCDEGLGYDPPNPLATGDPTDSRFASKMVFEGCVRVLPSHKYSFEDIPVNAEDGSPVVTLELTLVHIARACLEGVATSMLCTRVFNLFAPVNDGALTNIFYDMIWKNDAVGGHTFVRLTRGQGLDYCAYYPWFLVWQEMRALAAAIYRTYRRETTSAFRFVTGVHTAMDLSGTPLDHITMREWDYSKDGTPGAVIADDDKLFFGAAWATSAGGPLNDAIGGLLAPPDATEEKNATIQGAFTNCWDFLLTAVKASGLKMQLPSRSAGTCYVWFAKLLQNTQSGNRTIPVNVILAGEEFKAEKPGGIIRGSEVAIPAMEGEDKAEYTSQVSWRGVKEEATENVEALWHTSPRIGAPGSQSQTYRIAGFTKDEVSEIIGDYAGIQGAAPHSAWRVCYWKTPMFAGSPLTSQPVPIGVHPQVSIDYGGSVPIVSGGPFPLPYFSGGDLNENLDTWWDLLYQALLDYQRDSGLPQTVGELYALLFGNPNTIEYTDLVVPFGYVVPQWVGEIFTIGSGNGNTFLLPGRTYLAHLSTVVQLTEVSISKPDTDCHCRFQHVEAP